MYLFGTASWWIPRWLDRLLPHIDVEGEPDSAAVGQGSGIGRRTDRGA
jgi:RND superfamily putative drug exporter